MTNKTHPIFLSDTPNINAQPEQRQCNNCGEYWTCDGNDVCRFCGSDDTAIIEDEEAEND